jgi:hypothetical protein
VPEPTRTLVAQRSAAERLSYQNLIARMGGRAEPPPLPAIASVPSTVVAPAPGTPAPGTPAPGTPAPGTPASGSSGPFTVGSIPNGVQAAAPVPAEAGTPIPLARPEVVAAASPQPAAEAAPSTEVPTVASEPPVAPAGASYYQSLFNSGIWSATTSTIPAP